MAMRLRTFAIALLETLKNLIEIKVPVLVRTVRDALFIYLINHLIQKKQLLLYHSTRLATQLMKPALYLKNRRILDSQVCTLVVCRVRARYAGGELNPHQASQSTSTTPVIFSFQEART